MADELDLLLDSEQNPHTLNSAVLEMKDLFGEGTPYVKILKTYGICYKWDDAFIDGILLAFATDNIEQFSEEELIAWYSFIMFQDFHSHSALDTDCNTLAVGCTLPDEFFKSYVVCESGTITTTECQSPTYDVQDEQVWASLDRAMMALYNCQPIDDCNINDDYEETVPCAI